MKIQLLIVASGKYTSFLPRLLESADRFFFVDAKVEYCIFTDQVNEVREMGDSTKRRVIPLEIEHKPFPHATLKRFHFFSQHIDRLDADFFVYIDADCIFFDYVKNEIVPSGAVGRVAVQHCGFIEKRGTYEARPESTAYVAENEGAHYFAGSFFAFGHRALIIACEQITKNIDKDEANGITAIWWDESHWNRHLIDYPPTLILNPSYHFPQGSSAILDEWIEKGVFFSPKVIALKKNHNEIRGIEEEE